MVKQVTYLKWLTFTFLNLLKIVNWDRCLCNVARWWIRWTTHFWCCRHYFTIIIIIIVILLIYFDEISNVSKYFYNLKCCKNNDDDESIEVSHLLYSTLSVWIIFYLFSSNVYFFIRKVRFYFWQYWLSLNISCCTWPWLPKKIKRLYQLKMSNYQNWNKPNLQRKFSKKSYTLF